MAKSKIEVAMNAAVCGEAAAVAARLVEKEDKQAAFENVDSRQRETEEQLRKSSNLLREKVLYNCYQANYSSFTILLLGLC